MTRLSAFITNSCARCAPAVAVVLLIGGTSAACTPALPTEPSLTAQTPALVIHYPVGGVRTVASADNPFGVQFESYLIDADSGYTSVTNQAVWSSTDLEALAPARNRGAFFVRGAGSHEIVATYQGVQGRLPIEVRSAPATPFLEITSFAGGVPTLRLQLPGSGNSGFVAANTANWTTSDEQIATVDPSGSVTAKATGNVRIIATRDGLSDWYWRSVPPRSR